MDTPLREEAFEPGSGKGSPAGTSRQTATLAEGEIAYAGPMTGTPLPSMTPTWLIHAGAGHVLARSAGSSAMPSHSLLSAKHVTTCTRGLERLVATLGPQCHKNREGEILEGALGRAAQRTASRSVPTGNPALTRAG